MEMHTNVFQRVIDVLVYVKAVMLIDLMHEGNVRKSGSMVLLHNYFWL
jgi:hypothetical protein